MMQASRCSISTCTLWADGSWVGHLAKNRTSLQKGQLRRAGVDWAGRQLSCIQSVVKRLAAQVYLAEGFRTAIVEYK